jgi:hypothetical protein
LGRNCSAGVTRSVYAAISDCIASACARTPRTAASSRSGEYGSLPNAFAAGKRNKGGSFLGQCSPINREFTMISGDYGGETGIRTLGRRKPTTVFETAAFDHSATSPRQWVFVRRGFSEASGGLQPPCATFLRVCDMCGQPFWMRLNSHDCARPEAGSAVAVLGKGRGRH